MRFRNFVTDGGRSLNNGLHSTVSERIASWLDADGSASGHAGTPTILGSRPGGVVAATVRARTGSDGTERRTPLNGSLAFGADVANDALC